MESKYRRAELEKLDYIDSTLPPEVQEIQKKAVAYRRSQSYFEKSKIEDPEKRLE